MIPVDSWLAWWVCGDGSRHPIFFQFLGPVGQIFVLALVSKTRITVNQKFLERLTPISDPGVIYSDAFQLQGNRYMHGDGGQLAPQAEKAMAAVAGSPEHADSMYNERWRVAK